MLQSGNRSEGYRAIGDLVGQGQGGAPTIYAHYGITTWTSYDLLAALAAETKLQEITVNQVPAPGIPRVVVSETELTADDLQRLEGKLGEATNKLSALVRTC